MEARLAALKALGIASDAISFAARFGRNMEYYTGFVFELWSRDKEGPVQVAGGGRYDTLAGNARRRTARPRHRLRHPHRARAGRARRAGRRVMAALTLAIPSKGRLQGAGARLFRRCRRGPEAGGRRARLSRHLGRLSRYRCDAAVGVGDRRLAAGRRCASGHHRRGSDPRGRAGAGWPHPLVRPLGFGFANVVVAVPQYWIDVSTMADLDDVCAAFAQRHRRRLRIATKYTPADARLFRASGHQRLPHRGKRRRHRRRAGCGHRRSHRRHHHHRRDAWPPTV